MLSSRSVAFVGATLTKSDEGPGGYGHGYKYGKIGQKRTEIDLIPDQSDA